MSSRLVDEPTIFARVSSCPGNRDCLTVVNRIYRNIKLAITQNSSISDTRGGRGTRYLWPRRLVPRDERRPRVERSVEIAFLRGSRPHSRARLGVEQGVGVSRVRRVASQGRDETRARIARVSRGTSRHRTRGPDPHRLGRRPYGRRRWTTRRTRPTPRRGSSPATPTACWAMMPRRTTSTPFTCVSRPPRRPSRRAPAARQKRHRAISRHENGAPEQTRRKTLVPSLRRGARGRAPRPARARPGASPTSMAALESRSNRPSGSRASRRRRGTLPSPHPTWLRHRTRTRRQRREPSVGTAGRDALDRGGFTGRPVLTRSRLLFGFFRSFAPYF